MTRTRIGVMRGGVSDEHDVSLKTGAAVIENLPNHYSAIDIVIDKNGDWYFNGFASTPAQIFPHIDCAYIALHGCYGEDGKIQKICERFRMPYTGSEPLPSACGLNKHLAKKIFQANKLKTPSYIVFRDHGGAVSEDIFRLYRSSPQPSVIKTIDGGSSIGVFITHDFNSFESAFRRVLLYSPTILIEEYIKGREVTCGVIEQFRNDKLYALPPVEIIPKTGKDFFDYYAKYSGETNELCPASFSYDIKQEIMRMSLEAHKVLGLRHYSRSDFIVSPRGIYILETNSLPGLAEESLILKSCEAIGLSFPKFLDHVIRLALGKYI